MNHTSFFLPGVAVACALLMTPARLHSEAADTPTTPLQALIELKAANEVLLQKQKQTLQKLEELKTQADQLRIFSKRS